MLTWNFKLLTSYNKSDPTLEMIVDIRLLNDGSDECFKFCLTLGAL